MLPPGPASPPPPSASGRCEREDERRLSLRRSSGSFFIFRDSLLTVPGDLSLSTTFFWAVGLVSEVGRSGRRRRRSEQLTQPELSSNISSPHLDLLCSPQDGGLDQPLLDSWNHPQVLARLLGPRPVLLSLLLPFSSISPWQLEDLLGRPPQGWGCTRCCCRSPLPAGGSRRSPGASRRTGARPCCCAPGSAGTLAAPTWWGNPQQPAELLAGCRSAHSTRPSADQEESC